MKIPLSRPDITREDIVAVTDVLRTPQLSLGPKISEFEEKVAAFTGSKYAVVVNSGTSGLHLAIRALDIKDSDEVITTPFSFISSANCMLYERARPIFADIDPDTLNIDVEQAERKITKRTKAILPVHVFGNPCRMDVVMDVAKRRRLNVIEDACEAIGATYKGKRVGTFGACAVFAFYPNKQLTMGEGGVIVTDNKRISELCRSMRNQGRASNGKWLNHFRLGYNYRVSDIQCALGISQIGRIEEILKKREKVAGYYKTYLKGVNEIELPLSPEGTRTSWFVFVVRLNRDYKKKQRDEAMRRLIENGIECNNYFPPIHLQPFYRRQFGYKKGDFPITESVSERTIALPFYNRLKESEVRYVCDVLKASVKNL